VAVFAPSATAAFPPIAPVFVAFSTVVSAVTAVKADLDLLKAFFSDVGSELGTVSILEGSLKIINIQQLCTAVKAVFTATLRVCAFAVKLMRGKTWRLVMGAKTLFLGRNGRLADQYAALGAASKNLQDVISTSTLTITARVDVRVTEGFAKSEARETEHFEKLKDMISTKDPIGKIREKLKTLPKPGKEVEPKQPLEGTGEWLLQSDDFHNWIDDNFPIFWLHGLPGVGKTYLTYTVLAYLRQRERDYRRHSVAWFRFTGSNDDARSLTYALLNMVLEIAKSDETYARTIERHFKDDKEWQFSSLEDIWQTFFVEMYKPSSDEIKVQLSIVIDGVEEMDEERHELFKMWSKAKSDGLAIRFFLAGASDLDSEIVSTFDQEHFVSRSVNSDVNGADMKLFIDSSKKMLHNLNEETVQTVTQRLQEKGT